MNLVEVKKLCKNFTVEKGLFSGRGVVEAVKNVSFTISQGETVALVGESGSGKSTIGRLLQGLIEPTSGEILFLEKNSSTLSARERANIVQMIFQDPFASLNPKLSVGTMLREALILKTSQKDISQITDLSEFVMRKSSNLLRSVGLPADILGDYPHQFSGGQRQRLGIARALAMRPKLIIADEPVSALDISIQAQILNLLLDLKETLGISYLLISHDLSVVEEIADRVLVLHHGEIVEEGLTGNIFSQPQHEYTKTLLEAIPRVSLDISP